MQRDPNATSKARERERKEDEKSGLSFKPVKLGGDAGSLSKGFKKGGFRSAFGGGGAVVDVPVADGEGKGEGVGEDAGEGVVESESEREEDGYDPRRPTGCEEGCGGRRR